MSVLYGQEDLADERIPVFQAYQVNQQLLSQCRPRNSSFCIASYQPIVSGEEITEEVAMEGSRSRIWDQAEITVCTSKKLY
jgi:ornithine carbamoyltransferase